MQIEHTMDDAGAEQQHNLLVDVIEKALLSLHWVTTFKKISVKFEITDNGRAHFEWSFSNEN